MLLNTCSFGFPWAISWETELARRNPHINAPYTLSGSAPSFFRPRNILVMRSGLPRNTFSIKSNTSYRALSTTIFKYRAAVNFRLIDQQRQFINFLSSPQAGSLRPVGLSAQPPPWKFVYSAAGNAP